MQHAEEYVDRAGFFHKPVEVEQQQCYYKYVESVFYAEWCHSEMLEYSGAGPIVSSVSSMACLASAASCTRNIAAPSDQRQRVDDGSSVESLCGIDAECAVIIDLRDIPASTAG